MMVFVFYNVILLRGRHVRMLKGDATLLKKGFTKVNFMSLSIQMVCNIIIELCFDKRTKLASNRCVLVFSCMDKQPMWV